MHVAKYFIICLFLLSLYQFQTLYLISSLSLSLSLSISSFSSLLKKVAHDHSLVLIADLVASFSSPCHRHPQPSPPTSTTLIADLQISLNRVVGVRFGMGSDVGFGLALYGLWFEVLGQLGWGFRPIVG